MAGPVETYDLMHAYHREVMERLEKLAKEDTVDAYGRPLGAMMAKPEGSIIDSDTGQVVRVFETPEEFFEYLQEEESNKPPWWKFWKRGK